MIEYIKTDIIKFADEFDSPFVLIHGCNCFNTMGAGVGKAVADKWPVVKVADDITNKGDVMKLSDFSSAGIINSKGQRGTIINLYTQYNYGTNERHVDYGAIVSGMNLVYNCTNWRDVTFIMPKIGSGLGGGDWSIIERIIKKQFKDCKVFICTLED
jgi:O-acetyl-ADP-ribose deacetylase (regulator of RNase III)